MRYSYALSIVFYVCYFIYMGVGTYATDTNIKSRINRLFVFMMASLGLWAFAFSIMNSASTPEMGAFWGCISVFGWGVIYSILLHFVLILTKVNIPTSKWVMHSIMYAPAVINIILFAPFGILAEKQYRLVESDFGWVNVIPMNPGRIWLMLYYFSFAIASIALLFRWWIKLDRDDPQKPLAGRFILSVLFPFVLGVITDALPDMLGTNSFPQLVIIFMMVPVAVLSPTLRKTGLLLEAKQEVAIDAETGQHTDADRLRLFKTVASLFTMGSGVSFFIGYFVMERPLPEEHLLAAVILLLGLFIRTIPLITKRHSIQNTMLLMVGIISYVFLMKRNADMGAATIWSVYIVFFIFTIILDSRIHLYIFSGIVIASQIILAIFYPTVIIKVDVNQYMMRVALIFFALFAVYRAASEYGLKLDAHKRFIKEQKVIEAISTNFISITGDNAKEKVDQMLEMAAGILEFDYAYLIGFNDERETAHVFSIYAKDPDNPLLPYRAGTNVSFASIPMAAVLTTRGTPLICEAVTSTPLDECAETRNYIMSRELSSFFAYPLQIEGRPIEGMLVFEYSEQISRSLRENRSQFLNILVNMLDDARKKTLYEEMLYNFAYFDESTKLANRHMMLKRLEENLHERKESQKLAILNIEFDNLRMIKDTFGQVAVEQVMAKAAKIIENLLYKSHDIARTSEGEFVVVLNDIESRKEVEDCVQRLLDAFSHPISTSDTGTGRLFVLLSIGISMYPENGKDASTLLRNADLAAFEALNSNEDFVFYTERMGSNIEENTVYTNRLFESLQNKDFFLEFQPQINCESGKVAGVEALLRWTSDGSNRVPPLRFIPILEQTGLIYDVGLWVLDESLKEHNRLIEKGFAPLRVSANLSVVQFEEEEFISAVAKIIKERGVDPKYIELEITESLFSKDPEDVLRKLYQLKELGVSISIDDFGKGYSSLNRLKVVPFNRIKIDKELVDFIEVEKNYAPLTRMIISLAENFKASVTAEGMETKEQAEFLKSINCDEIQGYYFSKPLPPPALEEFLKKNMA